MFHWIAVVAIILFALWPLGGVSVRKLVVSGLVLGVLGWAGIVIGLMLKDQPILQNHAVVTVWVYASGGAVVLSPLIILKSANVWLGPRLREAAEAWLRRTYRRN